MVSNFFWNLWVNQWSQPFKGILVKTEKHKTEKTKKTKKTKKKTVTANATETSSTMLKQSIYYLLSIS